MLWKPVTHGEELFLKIHQNTGGALSISSENDPDFDYLISASDFTDFVRLSATMEVFVRCVRDARAFLDHNPGAGHTVLAKELRQSIALPLRLWQDREFSELVRLVAQTAIQKPRDKNVENGAISSVGAICYMCGTSLGRKRSSSNKYTVEHIWPIAFGGETREENLLPACGNCNSKRGHMLSWAAGPVQSTYLHKSEIASNALRFSLSLARLWHFAASGRKLRTLKEAALGCQPLMVDLDLSPGRHHLYFELLPKVRV